MEVNMKKKTAITVLVVILIGAILLGFLLLNKGDGPVMGMVLADTAIENAKAYDAAAQAQGDGVYLVVSSAFNKYQEDYKTDIPQGNDLYATIHFVECPKGSKFTAKWMKEGTVIEEDIGTLLTGPEGVIAYKLDGDNVVSGSYTFELYGGDGKIFEMTFSVK